MTAVRQSASQHAGRGVAGKSAVTATVKKGCKRSTLSELCEKDLDTVESFEELLEIAKLLQIELLQKPSATKSEVVAPVDSNTAQQDAALLRKAISKAFKSQMQFSKSLKHAGSKRLSFTTPCSAAAAAAAILFGGTLPSKGVLSQKKFSQGDLYGEFITKSIRYGYLSVLGEVNLKYSVNKGELKANASYSL